MEEIALCTPGARAPLNVPLALLRLHRAVLGCIDVPLVPEVARAPESACAGLPVVAGLTPSCLVQEKQDVKQIGAN